MTKERRNRLTALCVTVLVHVVVVVALVTMAFTTPLPLPEEAGVEVNLGMYSQGTGGVQPTRPTNVAPTPPPSPKTAEKDDVARQDTEETPAVEETKTDKPEEEVKPQQAVNQRALFKPKDSGDKPASEGDTGRQGDQGDPDGTPKAVNHEGHGGSGGTSYSLGGRNARHLPSPDRNFSEEGRVVVDIWVDRDGNVRKAEIGKGTTTTDTAMRDMARKAALSAKFSADKNAAELQKGTITYNFIIRQ